MHVEKKTSPSGGTTAALITVSTEERGGVDQAVEELLAEHGAVFLRGIGVAGPEHFRAVVDRFSEKLLDYRHGNSPRTQIGDGVYTSTDYPAGYDISLHNEMSYAPTWPSRLFFSCLVEPATGGATHLADGRALLRDLDSVVRDRFEGLGVTYRQNMHGGVGFGKSWQATYDTEDRKKVEEFLTAAQVGFEWTADNGLRTWQMRPGARSHQVSGDAVWFNQADQWHVSNLPEAEREALLGMVEHEQDLPLSVSYGDGSRITTEDLDTVRETAGRHALDVPWQCGDVLMVDNMSVLHGRRAFTGDRRILVSMA
ncbi:hypothetical protein BS329_20475 [Amycolatopsis coloradensis]|uniref:TauD/TfdA-like domain-containing protein n=1 Tax=Amycolatopsis coloradensis TaxID=76021 RepID=A0A1R0KR42_9PSEU|nr:TauD/TfdA family dioxygenase [Amycolatopsis coloradensis]OLZ50119.1 hypothetical protein BS329_20475 [Amycolatopsis coloradensis]